MDILILIAVLALMAFGTFSAFLPVVPGPAVVWFGAIIYGFATNFRDVGPMAMIILTVLMLAGSTTNIWMSALGGKAAGGSILGILGGLIGMIVGTFILFPLGALVGVVVGTLATEFAVTGDWRKTLRIGTTTMGSFLLGVVAEFMVAAIMDVIFVVSILSAHRLT